MSIPALFQSRPLHVVSGVLLACAAVLSEVPAASAAAARSEKPPAASWPRWRGPDANGVSSESGWSTDWPEGGPKRLWRAHVGRGYSAVAVAGGRVYTMGNRNGTDTVWCLDAGKGTVVWKHSYPCAGKSYPGPRATPTVEAGRVYTLSRDGQVFCLDAEKGTVVWSKNVAAATGARPPTWGFASSPVVEGDLLLLNVSSAGTALFKTTGKVAWKSPPGKSGYATPVVFDAGGRRCAAIFSAKSLVVVDVKTGRKLWSYPWKTSYDVNAADPIVLGDKMFISSGYKHGCALLQFGRGTPRLVYQNGNMQNHFSSSVLYKGHLYGSSGNVNSNAALVCIDFRTGQVKWSKRGFKMTSLMIADGKLVILTQNGLLAVAEATPAGFKPLAQAKVMKGTCWTVPVLAGGKIYCRNHEGELICLDVAGR